jgi:phage portal protein BeeE
VRLSPLDVLHIPGLGFDGLVGYSPIAMAKNSIGMAIACEEYGAKFFANGATPGGILEHPGVVKDPERVRESWNSAFGGSANSNKVAVLEEGMKYTPISISPEQAQFLETRKFQIDEIARIFRIPPHMIGDLEKSSFSNIEQQSLEFVKVHARPVGEPLGTVHAQSTPPPRGEEGILLQVQRRRASSRRLPKPHERLRHRTPERLDVARTTSASLRTSTASRKKKAATCTSSTAT